MKPTLGSLAFGILIGIFSTTAMPAAGEFRIVVIGTQTACRHTPVKVRLEHPDDKQKDGVQGRTQVVRLRSPEGDLVGQLTGPSLLSEQVDKQGELHFVIPSLEKGAKRVYDVEFVDRTGDQPSFAWSDSAGDHWQLSFDGRPVLRYMYRALDESSAETREQTFKVFHHVFDPGSDRLVTKGPGGRYSHHRGLFYGFNRIRYGQRQADVWHCRQGESQQHRALVGREAGPVIGRQRLAIDWHGRDGQIFAHELRELTVYNVPDGHLIEFASRLHSRVPRLKLDGDPQHAGFQFRASQEVAASTHQQTYYLRPDGRGKLGETRNWTRENPSHRNLPWNAQSFVLGDQRFTCCYLDHPLNPKPARYSERDYGRFGSYFEHQLTPQETLDVNYRIWLQRGEMEGSEVAALSHDFVDPPTVQVVGRD